MDIITPLVNTGISLVSAYFGYMLGRRSKIDEIQIAKRHELAEKLSIFLQEDFNDRLNLRKEYHNNFDHLRDLSEAMHYFNQYDNLYSSLHQGIARIPARFPSFIETNQRATIYLPESVTSPIAEYIELTKFTYMTDGIGIINDYAERFFEHLLDDKTWTEMENRHKLILGQLRRSVK
jgi:hypothetical protein